jgi:hypothetical protein
MKNSMIHKFMVHPSYETFGYALRIQVDDMLGAVPMTRFVQPVVMSTVEEGHIIPKALDLSRQEIQGLMDELWRNGFRPSNVEGVGGELTATKYHLEDMRKMAFDKFNSGER